VLWERGDTTVKELGTALMLDSGTLSPLLKRLEAAGLVRRRRSSADERSVLVGLTPTGDRLRRSALEVPGTVAEASGLPPAELSALRDTLVALTEAVTGSGATATPREART
jgi:MarR family transcriptional regulator, organic hydroperoxide resistance regulator